MRIWAQALAAEMEGKGQTAGLVSCSCWGFKKRGVGVMLSFLAWAADGL